MTALRPREEPSPYPEDASPSGRAAVRKPASTQASYQTTDSASKEGEAVRQSSVLERQDLRWYGLHDGDGGKCCPDETSTSSPSQQTISYAGLEWCTHTPPPISIDIDEAFADTIAPTVAINGGIAAMYFRSTTSESRPTTGLKQLCISNGAWMIQPAIEASPRSRMMKAMTEPAATTTY